MSHYHFADGTAYAPTVFGETDATTGEWKIKTSPSFTLGTNGFTILKDGNTITDQSSNSNNWTLGGGTLTNTEDCPSDVFNTMNALALGSGVVLSNGNNTVTYSSNAYRTSTGTLGMTAGKYYWEFKIPADRDYLLYGITSVESSARDADVMTNYKTSYSKISYGTDFRYNTAGGAYSADNNYFYMHKNGTYINSGDPTSGATGTGGKAVVSGLTYFPMTITYGTSIEFNFGNGYFGTTVIASEGTNASGIGKFEYDVPTGYTALSTKGLNA
jgi:hypothetical protein